MDFLNYLCQLEDGTICIHPDCNKSLGDNKKQALQVIISEIKYFEKKFGATNKFIILLNLKETAITESTLDIKFLTKLRKVLVREFPDKLNKLIIYDYSEKMLCVIHLIRLLIGKEYRDKILIDKNYKIFIDNLLTKTHERVGNNREVIVNNSESRY